MKTVLIGVVGFLAFLLLVGTLLRIRKLRRDRVMRESIGVDPRPRRTPPSTYEPAKSFRRLELNEEPTEYVIERPRIDPVRRQFFDDGEDRYDQYPQPVSRGRHDNDWLLDRSRHRSNPLRVVGIVVVAVLLAVAGSGVAYYFMHRTSHH